MRLFGLLMLTMAAPAMAQEAVPEPATDAADGYPMEPRYTDNSADLPKDGFVLGAPAPSGPPVVLGKDGAPLRTNRLVLTRGQTIVFRVDADGMATDIRHVDSKTQPAAGEIRAYMGGNGGNTTLLVLNRGNIPFDYSVHMLKSADAATGERTSVCTLLPGITAYEMWPYPIAALAIGGFMPAPDGEMVCK